jgi:hypothetical protein
MDERIEAFLKDVLALEGKFRICFVRACAVILQFMRSSFATLKRTNGRRISSATRAQHNVRHTWAALSLCGKGTSTAEHLKIVLSIIDSAALFPLNDE